MYAFIVNDVPVLPMFSRKFLEIVSTGTLIISFLKGKQILLNDIFLKIFVRSFFL